MSAPFNLTVLIAMEDGFERRRVAKLVEKTAAKVITAKHGHEALTFFREDKPDIILCDNVLPVLDMPLLINAVRTISQDVPFIVLYDDYNPKSIIRAAEAGTDAFLHHPVDPDALLVALRKTARTVYLRRKLAQASKALWRVIDHFPLPAVLMKSGRSVHMNPRLLSWLGYPSHQAMKNAGDEIGKHIISLNGQKFMGGDWVEMIVEDPLDRDHIIRLKNPANPNKDGSFVVNCTIFPDSDLTLCTLRDVTEFEEDKAYLQDEASTDPLTKAMNRRSFMQRVDALVSEPKQGLIMFDIDHFKSINDTYGHDVGDAVLREISQLMRDNIRETDLLARWGGEEFMVLSPGADMERTKALAERLREAVASFDFTGVPRQVTSSFGVVVRSSGEDTETYLKRADTALYEAKESGRNRVVCG